MYQALLTRRYLLSKIMPLLAALGVALCTAMVLITWSVMGGFLKTLLESGRSMVGDVSIRWPYVGFAHYDDLILRLEADPDIEAASPVIQTLALLALPDGKVKDVLLNGIDGESFHRVTGYHDHLWWRPLAEPLPKDEDRSDWRVNVENAALFERMLAAGQTLTEPDLDSGAPKPAIVLGVEVTGYNFRDPDGVITPGVPYAPQADGSVERKGGFLANGGELTMHVLPLSTSGRAIEMVTRTFPVANEFRSGVFDVDNSAVFIRLDALQTLLNLDEATRLADDADFDPFALNPDGSFAEPPATQIDPARVTTVLVRGRDGLGPDEIKDKVRAIYAEFASAHRGEVPSELEILLSTWEEQNRTLIAAVRKETSLVLFIFSFISLTAVFLVLAIFWSMVSEKTRDIGVLRALGAGAWGVAGVWLAYGVAIGVLGSITGGLIAWAVVRNINEIHEWIGRTTGQYIWDPAVYYFTEIPSKLDPFDAAMVLSGGVISCVIGAAWPALRAAHMRPVRALRFE